MSCVVVGSVMNGGLNPAKRTCSIAEIRASDRASRVGIFCFGDVGSNVIVAPAFKQQWLTNCFA